MNRPVECAEAQEQQPGQAEEKQLLERADSIMPVIKKIEAGQADEQTREAFRNLMRSVPAACELLGNAARRQVDRLLALEHGKGVDLLATTEYVEAMRRDLGYEKASALERGLIEHIVMCWLRLCRAERLYTQWTAKEWHYDLGDAQDRMLSAAQSRYLRAVEALARMRRLSVRALQVNIAGKQLNVAQLATRAVLRGRAAGEEVQVPELAAAGGGDLETGREK